MKWRANPYTRNEDAANTAERESESGSFIFEQKRRYRQEIGNSIEELLSEAAERGFKRDLWTLDDHFLDRIDALCGDIRTRATIYYGISRAANRTLLQELNGYVKHLQSGLDVLCVQLSENSLAQRKPPRYQRSVSCTLQRLQELEKKLLRANPEKRYADQKALSWCSPSFGLRPPLPE